MNSTTLKSNWWLAEEGTVACAYHHGPLDALLEVLRPVRLARELGVLWRQRHSLLGELLLHRIQLVIKHGEDVHCLLVNRAPDRLRAQNRTVSASTSLDFSVFNLICIFQFKLRLFTLLPKRSLSRKGNMRTLKTNPWYICTNLINNGRVVKLEIRTPVY